MKNHWIQLYEQKKRKIWTAEFSSNGIFSLKPRRVEVEDAKYALGFMGQKRGAVSIIFPGAMFAANDHELMNFLSHAHHHDIAGYISRLRLYQGLSNELENYELSDLHYDSLTSGITVDDIKFRFRFEHLRHFHVA